MIDYNLAVNLMQITMYVFTACCVIGAGWAWAHRHNKKGDPMRKMSIRTFLLLRSDNDPATPAAVYFNGHEVKNIQTTKDRDTVKLFFEESGLPPVLADVDLFLRYSQSEDQP